MGRKIPGKKHRGVKDPKKYQLEQREKLNQLINCPPSNPNIQEIPKTVLEMNRLRELVKNGKFNKKKKKKKMIERDSFARSTSQLTGLNQKEKLWPSLKQRPSESNGAYLWRIDNATNEILNEIQIKTKHNIEDRQDVIEKYNIKNSLNYNEKFTKNGDSKCVLDRKNRMKIRRKLKLKKKILKKSKSNEEALEKKKDIVKFGEVAHQPPQLNRRPRGCNVEKPGCKQLLLKSMFSSNKSMLQIKQLAEEREKALKAYEAMKLKTRSRINH